MRRVAAIDCGTNSIRLLVADVDSHSGTLADVERQMEIVRLGQGVDRTGEFAAEALERTYAACRLFGQRIRQLECERVRFVATSATRDVANRQQFVVGVREILGIDPEVLSGVEEAVLSYDGATRELTQPGRRDTELPPFLVVDIGGGSTEFVLGGPADEDGAGDVPLAVSADIGCVRMTERHLLDDPPAHAQVAAAQAEIDAAIAAATTVVPLRNAGTLVGLAGSVTTVAAMAMDLPSYQPEEIHGSRIAAGEVHVVAERLLAMSRRERAALPFMHPGRVDVIGAGALILSRTMAAADVGEVLVSEHDILDGIAFSIG